MDRRFTSSYLGASRCCPLICMRAIVLHEAIQNHTDFKISNHSADFLVQIKGRSARTFLSDKMRQ